MVMQNDSKQKIVSSQRKVFFLFTRNRPISHQMEDQASYLQFTSTVNGVAQEAQFWGIFDGHNGWVRAEKRKKNVCLTPAQTLYFTACLKKK